MYMIGVLEQFLWVTSSWLIKPTSLVTFGHSNLSAEVKSVDIHYTYLLEDVLEETSDLT